MYRPLGAGLDGLFDPFARQSPNGEKREEERAEARSPSQLTGGRSECCWFCRYSSLEPISENLSLAWLPITPMATMQTTAMRARSSAYSTRAAPRSFLMFRVA